MLGQRFEDQRDTRLRKPDGFEGGYASPDTHLMMTMMPSKMLYGFLRYSKKPKAVSFRIISSVNMLVNTMLQISRTLVSSSGWAEVGWGWGGVGGAEGGKTH